MKIKMNPADKFRRPARVLKTVGHPDRLAIVEMLEHGEMSVNEIAEVLGTKQSITSQHLNMMRDKGVLYARREGIKVFYGIENKNVIRLLHCIHQSCDTSLQDQN
ncbi:MAG: winged helix-turn-helix transcriptional regulator [Sedimentisphaerales bacterium]|nr:winged helix-turn-helix transcriptional regulator [Sedimentisphaerales bacterium]